MKKRSAVLVCPTGGGKTIMGAAMASGHAKNGGRVVWLAHRAELVNQAAKTFESLGCSVKTIVAGKSTGEGLVTVASIDTVRSWSDLPSATMVVIDECHHARADTWQKLIERYDLAFRVGLTATPQRHDGRGLGDVFSAIVTACTIKDLTAGGHLVPCRVFAPPQNTEGLAAKPVEAYQTFGNWQSAVLFATTLEQARTHCEEFLHAGIASAVISGEMPMDERAATLQKFADGEIGVLCNVAVLTEGWDCPRASVAIMARGCSHAGLYLQIVGRVLRPAKDKIEARLIDLRGVSFVHGLPDAERTYSLSDDPILTRAEDVESITQCQKCGAVFEWAPQCPRCGYCQPPKKRVIKLTPAEIVERYAGDSDSQKTAYRQRLEAIAREKNYRRGWIEHMWRAKYGDAK